MALTKTRIQLVNRVATKLMIVGSGQSLPAEDFNVIDDIVDSVLADLNARTIIYVDDSDAVDIAAFEWIADVLADTAAPDFGIPRDPNKVAIAEMRLQEINAGRPTYEPMVAEYF